ncbi:MAG TPA: hypothetical protein DDZ80_25410 [Cyanobacteria bacterium UBA8803]|nr:hypothetical protein [Cyanobacteria bacterium UBA9273]HBL61633.1 hypothetical protein [Cyanobacteria bacterium UBA8803]
MQVRWKTLIIKIGIWLTVEVVLNILGLNNIANYSEFIQDRDLNLAKKNKKTVKISNSSPIFCKKVNEFCPITELKIEDLELSQTNYCNTSPVFKHRCKKLKNPCIKALILPNC